MRIRHFLAAVMLCAAAPLHAQRAIDLTADMLERFLAAYDAEADELKKVDPQIAEIDAKLKKFRDCKAAFDAAGDATGSRLGGIAARAAIRARCGASSEDDILNEKKKITEGPENAAIKLGKFKADEYRTLKDRISAFLRGDRNGFTKPGLDLLAARESALSSKFGISVVQAGGGGGMGTIAVPGVWSMDYAWAFIGQLFAVQYMSGATAFEKQYQPGEWTRWEITVTGEKAKQTMERAFLFKTADGTGEWWRLKTTMTDTRDGKEVVDTVTLEALFKSMGDNLKQLVRMRGKLPGSAEGQEMIVPQAMAMLPLSGALGMRPTPESIEGATVGTETVAGVSAKRVRFGSGGGTIEWWIAESVPGGWVQFKATNNNSDRGTYQMLLVGKGTGAASELGIKP